MALGSGGHYHYGLTLLLMDRATEALDHYLTMEDDRPEALAGRAMALYSLGRIEESQAVVADLQAAGPERAQAVAAEVASWTGDRETAFAWLFGELKDRTRLAAPNVFYPVWRPLHDDPRWQEWREASGQTQARFDAIEFDPELPE